jgi:predicted Fe-S protein YdhL (DUF1289 family)
MSKETPCIAVCLIDPKTSLCYGCGRTLPEIARWHRIDSAERLAIMATLPARMVEAGLVPFKGAARTDQPAGTGKANPATGTGKVSPAVGTGKVSPAVDR